jgi:hypothetical protein
MPFLSILLLLIPATLTAQLAAYVDSRDQFVVFDNGQFETLEIQPPKDFKVSSRYVAYIDNQEDFKVYHHGKVRTLERHKVNNFYCTDDIVVYEITNQVYVYREGWKKLISIAARGYDVNDSVVSFYDGYQRKLVVYMGGHLRAVADGILDDPIRQFKTGSDLVAFIESATSDFRVYWNGGHYTLTTYVESVDFQTGAGTVAYIDAVTGEFKVFFQGETQILEPFRPASYQTGNGIVAYVTQNGTFKVFENGNVEEVLSFAPEAYRVAEDLVTFSTLDQLFQVYWHGETHTLSGFVPEEYHISDGMVVFVNQQQQVEGFYHGKPVLFTSDPARKIAVQGQSIVVRLAADRVKIIVGEQVYERRHVTR